MEGEPIYPEDIGDEVRIRDLVEEHYSLKGCRNVFTEMITGRYLGRLREIALLAGLDSPRQARTIMTLVSRAKMESEDEVEVDVEKRIHDEVVSKLCGSRKGKNQLSESDEKVQNALRFAEIVLNHLCEVPDHIMQIVIEQDDAAMLYMDYVRKYGPDKVEFTITEKDDNTYYHVRLKQPESALSENMP